MLRPVSLLIAACLQVGCAHTPKPHEAVELTKQQLVTVDIVVTELQKAVELAQRFREEICMEQPLDQREACMGALLETAPAFEATEERYDNVVEALDALAEAVEEVERLAEIAKKEIPQ